MGQFSLEPTVTAPTSSEPPLAPLEEIATEETPTLERRPRVEQIEALKQSALALIETNSPDPQVCQLAKLGAATGDRTLFARALALLDQSIRPSKDGTAAPIEPWRSVVILGECAVEAARAGLDEVVEEILSRLPKDYQRERTLLALAQAALTVGREDAAFAYLARVPNHYADELIPLLGKLGQQGNEHAMKRARAIVADPGRTILTGRRLDEYLKLAACGDSESLERARTMALEIQDRPAARTIACIGVLNYAPAALEVLDAALEGLDAVSNADERARLAMQLFPPVLRLYGPEHAQQLLVHFEVNGRLNLMQSIIAELQQLAAEENKVSVSPPEPSRKDPLEELYLDSQFNAM